MPGPDKPRDGLTRRCFASNAIAAGAAVALTQPYGGSAFGQASSPTLSLYIALWQSEGEPIDWRSLNPRKIAEQFSFLIWAYRWSFDFASIFLGKDKGSVIGHAALLAILRVPNHQPEILAFSNTGGNVGVYRRRAAKFPNRFPYKKKGIHRQIQACFYVGETLTAHAGDGHWETTDEFRKRVKQRRDPKIQKKLIVGDAAVQTFKLLKDIKAQTEPFRAGAAGGPLHYGTNTTRVRWLEKEDKPPLPPRPMTKYNIGGREYEIHGGCANAVASVLEAAGHGDLVPRDKIQFEFGVTLNSIKDIVLPVLIGRHAFDPDGTALDEDLKSELARVPTQWQQPGDKEPYPVRLLDPNHWYAEVPDRRDLLREFKTQLER
jgi:hypothetical protein